MLVRSTEHAGAIARLAGLGLLGWLGCASVPGPHVRETQPARASLGIRVVSEELGHKGFSIALEYESDPPLLVAHVIETRTYFPIVDGKRAAASLAYRTEWWEWFHGAQLPGDKRASILRWDFLKNANVGPWIPQMGVEFGCDIERRHEYYLGAVVSGQRPIEYTDTPPQSLGLFGVLAEGPLGAEPIETATVGTGATAQVVRPRTPNPQFSGRAGVIVTQGERVGRIAVYVFTEWRKLPSSWRVRWRAERVIERDPAAPNSVALRVLGSSPPRRTIPWKDGPNEPDLPWQPRNAPVALPSTSGHGT